MKKIVIILAMLVLTGCATMQYKSPDGTEINYTRIATTSDSIKAEVGDARLNQTAKRLIRKH